MANKKVTVSSPSSFFSTEMDEAVVEAWVAAARVTGYFKSPTGDIFIPFNSCTSIVANATTFEQATRDDTKNFGPTP